ncbi:PRC and DUF2382 domain-containing protein [Janibacter terrae]|uniref:PRC and DUF2382 domain-containing protein n=1 Tax=Janibacter terrae TaxID=103817 RepID=A0ABZ2FBJ9_9MICO|nr:PRC and DUF2382 domain-containing protein [Janibacter terrae]MBA4085048.1 DUF2382 domain-containing protein [Kytococcus sp.]HCA88526.1 DUF2382 domain-containing protein [Streptomyces sp.]
MISTDQINTLVSGGIVTDTSGEKVGQVGQIYLDDANGRPEWVTVSTGLFGTSESFVPLRGATVRDDSEIQVAFTKAVIKDAPRVDADGHLDADDEAGLYRYYEIEDTGGGDERVGEGQDTSGPNTDDAMTRSEERLDVGTEKVATGRARLRKYVVTENVTTTVPVQREEVRLEREPITDANRDQALAGGELTEEEHEVTLTQERVVVNKETVPVERVRLGTETVTEEQQITEQVRKEQIEADLPDGVDPRDRS